jgi:undecaprenyl diphosphate synthase
MSVPSHIALILDGNGRWAKKRLLPRLAGHKVGIDVLKRLLPTFAKRGVKILTVYAFSIDNWRRPEDEVSGLMDMLALALAHEVGALVENGVELRFVGDRAALSPKMLAAIVEAERKTATGQRIRLNVCFNYCGRWDIAQAARKLQLAGEPITERSLNTSLAFADCPDPELVIRSGGEQRLSNFLLWQIAYSEIILSDVLWPDWDEAVVDEMLETYASRERRFGRITEQVESEGLIAPVLAG